MPSISSCSRTCQREWKDEDEFEELLRRRVFTAEEVSSVRSEGERMVQAVEERAAPFSDGWERWRPDPTWPVPEIPESIRRLAV